MSHSITQREDGTYEFAYAGEKAWHGLGVELNPEASIDQWKKSAGMDWEAFESIVQYTTMSGLQTFPDKKVIFRSDTNIPLSVVGSDYKLVQPGQVLEFFDDLTRLNGFKLSAAGTLFGGKRFWATAEIGKNFQAVSGDTLNGQLLLVTSLDGTLSTQAKVVATRTVCNNTLSVALGESSKNVIKTTHRTDFDASKVKINLGLMDKSWDQFVQNTKKMYEVKVDDSFVENYFTNMFYDKSKTADDQSWGAVKKVGAMVALAKSGTGSDYTKGTAASIMNAVTEYYTHGGIRKQNNETMFWDNLTGSGDKVKSKVYQDMIAICA